MTKLKALLRRVDLYLRNEPYTPPSDDYKEERRLTRKEREAQWRARDKNRTPGMYGRTPDNPRISVDADHYWEKIEGQWYRFDTERWLEPCSYQDLVQEGGTVKIITVKMPDRKMHKTTKRQVNSKMQKELDRKFYAK